MLYWHLQFCGYCSENEMITESGLSTVALCMEVSPWHPWMGVVWVVGNFAQFLPICLWRKDGFPFKSSKPFTSALFTVKK